MKIKKLNIIEKDFQNSSVLVLVIHKTILKKGTKIDVEEIGSGKFTKVDIKALCHSLLIGHGIEKIQK
jgi:hypothetical protein